MERKSSGRRQHGRACHRAQAAKITRVMGSIGDIASRMANPSEQRPEWTQEGPRQLIECYGLVQHMQFKHDTGTQLMATRLRE